MFVPLRLDSTFNTTWTFLDFIFVVLVLWYIRSSLYGCLECISYNNNKLVYVSFFSVEMFINRKHLFFFLLLLSLLSFLLHLYFVNSLFSVSCVRLLFEFYRRTYFQSDDCIYHFNAFKLFAIQNTTTKRTQRQRQCFPRSCIRQNDSLQAVNLFHK